MRVAISLAAAIGLATPAIGEVLSSGPNGFEIRHSVTLAASPQRGFDAFGRIGAWWSDGHTYSGDAANLSLALAPGGCFCERFPKGGGIEHMRVVLVQPGERLVMAGALGPLLYEASNGMMDVRLEPVAGGSRLILDYRASGFARGGAAGMAPIVDKVLGEQVRRLAVFVAATPAR